MKDRSDAPPRHGRTSIRPVLFCLGGLFLAFSSTAKAGPYMFTLVADDTGLYQHLAAPALNNRGDVGFEASLDDGGQGIFRGPDPRRDAVATSDGPYASLRGAAINDAGTVAFQAFLDDGSDGIFTGPDPMRDAVATSRGVYSFFSTPAINSRGVVAFEAGLDDGRAGIFKGPDAVRDAVVTSDVYSSFGPFPDINDAGTVAFVAGLPTGEGGIFTGSNPDGDARVREGPDDTGPSPSSVALNDVDAVALFGRFAGGFAVFRNNELIASDAGPFANFNAPALNDEGLTAFFAALDDGRSGVFTGPNPLADKVIATGDDLFGSAVTRLAFTRDGLNDRGELAFEFALADGRSGIAVAMPAAAIPLPPAFYAGLIGLGVAGAMKWRIKNGFSGRRSNRNENPLLIEPIEV